MRIARYVQVTQNNKSAISLQYLKENIKDEVDFLPAYKHQSFLDFGNIILGLCGKTFLKYLKHQVVCYFFEYLKTEVSN